ncbi:MAG: hypothetical protein NVS3B28_24350 [Candidatus Velthaea sp.]
MERLLLYGVFAVALVPGLGVTFALVLAACAILGRLLGAGPGVSRLICRLLDSALRCEEEGVEGAVENSDVLARAAAHQAQRAPHARLLGNPEHFEGA